RQQQPFQQPPPPVPPQQKPSSSTPPSSIETALEKHAQSTASFVQNTHSFMNEHDQLSRIKSPLLETWKIKWVSLQRIY
ncbi:hypothetical protein PIB30_109928, partial [Stylosanthes scabra]|nr:hypothetical protein [Stylosanthes scabra]